jgi:hypothetical protein
VVALGDEAVRLAGLDPDRHRDVEEDRVVVLGADHERLLRTLVAVGVVEHEVRARQDDHLVDPGHLPVPAGRLIVLVDAAHRALADADLARLDAAQARGRHDPQEERRDDDDLGYLHQPLHC